MNPSGGKEQLVPPDVVLDIAAVGIKYKKI